MDVKFFVYIINACVCVCVYESELCVDMYEYNYENKTCKSIKDKLLDDRKNQFLLCITIIMLPTDVITRFPVLRKFHSITIYLVVVSLYKSGH